MFKIVLKLILLIWLNDMATARTTSSNGMSFYSPPPQSQFNYLQDPRGILD